MLSRMLLLMSSTFCSLSLSETKGQECPVARPYSLENPSLWRIFICLTMVVLPDSPAPVEGDDDVTVRGPSRVTQ